MATYATLFSSDPAAFRGRKHMNREALHAVLTTGVSWRDTLTLYALAAVAGMFGGCGTVGVYLTRKQRYALYALLLVGIGASTGMITGALMLALGDYMLHQPSLHDILGLSAAAGSAGSSAVLLLSVASRIILRWNNMSVELQVADRREAPREEEASDDE